MSKSLGNGVDLGEQIDNYGVDAIRTTVVFAGPPEDDIDWADVSPSSTLRFLQRAYRLATEVSSTPGTDPTLGDVSLRRQTHKTIHEATEALETHRFNVEVARVMELVNATRKAVDSGCGAGDPAVREAVEAVAVMLSVVAPYVAEEMWDLLGHPPSIANAVWPDADPDLRVSETTTMVVQVQGKVRAKLDIPTSLGEEAAVDLALADPGVIRALNGRGVAQVIVRLPKLVSIVPEK